MSYNLILAEVRAMLESEYASMRYVDTRRIYLDACDLGYICIASYPEYRAKHEISVALKALGGKRSRKRNYSIVYDMEPENEPE